jgi:hypothetical protein
MAQKDEIPVLLLSPAPILGSPVRDIDMARNDRTGGDFHRYCKERAQYEDPDLYWTPPYGGHWVASRTPFSTQSS